MPFNPSASLYGYQPAAALTPKHLKTVREAMIAKGWSRRHINKQVQRIRHMFQWGAEEGYVPGETWHALKAVAGLRKGRTVAPEERPVLPVPGAIVEATLRHCTPTLAAMIEVQRRTGMRPGELCIMRTGDIDTTGRIWIYRPMFHKTDYRGRGREVYIGPKAQEWLGPRLKPDLQAWIFSPAESEAERMQAIHSKRVTPANQGNQRGSNRKADPRRSPADRWSTQSYGRAIGHACDRAWPLPEDLRPLKGESPMAWRRRLGDRWREVLAWRREHRWAPNQSAAFLRFDRAARVWVGGGADRAGALAGGRNADLCGNEPRARSGGGGSDRIG